MSDLPEPPPSKPGPRSVPRILTLVGSLREGSYAALAARVAASAAEAAGARVTVFDLAGLPLCDGRKDAATYPPQVADLRARVLAADALLLATPEYHNSFSGVLKNALDLLSADQLSGKLCGLISVAGGNSAMSSLSHLRIVLRAVHAWVLPQQAMVPEAWRAFGPDGEVREKGIAGRLREVGRLLAEHAGRFAAS